MGGSVVFSLGAASYEFLEGLGHAAAEVVSNRDDEPGVQLSFLVASCVPHGANTTSL
jgi:hypothetical protein